jgi:uncharacterized protein (TIGR02996 family)
VSERTERDAFLKALAANEDDTTTRLVYADWLDERGEHEEADRMRKWDAAKAWLVRLCEQNNSPDLEAEWVVSYEKLLQAGRDAVEKAGEDGYLGLWVNFNYDMGEALTTNTREFWTNWSIVTGIPVPPDAEQKTYVCTC